MHLLLKLGAGVLARFVGMLAEQFAQWLFHEVSEGSDDPTRSLSELCHFGRWFVRMVASQLGGRQRRQFDGYEEEYQPDFYGAR